MDSFLNSRIVPFLLVLLIVFPLQAADPNEFEIFNYDFRSNGTVNLPGRLFVPENYDPEKSYPLVIYFHGAGERGDNNTSQVNHQINNLLARAKQEDFFLYAPQLSASLNTWNITSIDNTMRMAANATREYSIDPQQIHNIGFSLGGGASWSVVSRYSDAIASTVPVAGILGGEMQWPRVVGQSIWAYHAVNDSTVGVGNTRNQLNHTRNADGGKPPVVFPLNANPDNPYYNTGAPFYSDGSTFYEENHFRYTEYATGNHGIFGRVTNEAALYDWMLSQTATSAALQAGEATRIDFGNSIVNTPDSSGRIWNSTAFGFHDTLGNTIPFARTEEGRRTSVMVDMMGEFDFHITSTQLEGSIFDANIGNDGWFTSGIGTILIRGLTPGELYDIEIFATHNTSDGGRGRLSRYEINGFWVDLEAHNNIDQLAIFQEMAADAAGQIFLQIFASPDGDARYGQINTLNIIAVPEPSAAHLGFSLLAVFLLFRGKRRAA